MVNISVPYNPIMQGPENIPTPYRTEAGATPEAFGAGVGQALERLGGQVERTGDVLGQQALARQDLTNRADTDKADAEFMTRAGAEHMKFSSMEGGARAAYYPTYVKNLQAIREDIRGRLPNPMVQRMFDSQSLSTLGRTIFNGAGAAGTGAAEDASRSAALRASAISDQGGLAENDAQADDLAKQGYAAGVKEAKLAGVTDPGALDEAGKKRAGEVYHNYITKKAETNSQEADKFLEQHEGAMTEQQRDSARHAVRTQRESVETANTATSILDANRDENKVLKVGQRELEDQAVAQAKQLHPNDPEFAIRLKNQVGTQFRKEQAENHADRVNNLNVIRALVIAGADSKQEIMANPQGERAARALPPDVDVEAQIHGFVAARDRQHNEEQMRDLKWMMKSDPENFLLLDPFDPKLKLSANNQKTIVGWQMQTAKSPGQRDSRPWHALSLLQAHDGQALVDAGVTRKDPDTFNSYMSHLSDALESWRDTHGGKPPTEKDLVETIGPSLIKKVAYPGWLWGTNQEEAFKRPMETPPEIYSKPLAAQGYTEEQIQRQWRRERLKQIYGSKVSSDAKSFGERFENK